MKKKNKYLNLTGKKLPANYQKKIKDFADNYGDYEGTIIDIEMPKYFNFNIVEEFTNEVIAKIKREDIFGVILSKNTPSLFSYILGIKTKACDDIPCFLVYLNPIEKEQNGFEGDRTGSFQTPEEELRWLKKV